MKRLLALLASAVALSACSNPTAPSTKQSSVDEVKAKAAVEASARRGPNARISFN